MKRLRFKSINKSVQNANKDLLGSVKETVKKQLRQQLRSPQQLELAGVGFIEDTGTVGRNTPTPSPKPSNTQPSQNGSNKKPAEDKGTKKVEVPYGEHITKVGNKKVLQPNVKYKTEEGYSYETNEFGHIISAEGDLQLGTGKRNPYAQSNVGGTDPNSR
ncbi:hypothetical protein J2B92_15215 [Lysinibacillus sphaericus]|uniref:DNA/RNA non-specific endonuclease n=1 Tax=Lysinibacillus sphaericus TaxID=1421 RepID=UPI0018CF9FFF|nr:hypothetical protein J2B92_15215 [Lysinibacillus sphaericus]